MKPLILLILAWSVKFCKSVEIQPLEGGFIFENLGQAYVDKGEIIVRTQQSLSELKNSFSHMKTNTIGLINTCERYYINSSLPNNYENCKILKEHLDLSISDIETLFEYLFQNSPRKHRGLEDIALGILNLEFIDPTRVENVKRLNDNQRLLTSHIETNSHAINDQVDVIHALETTISDQSHYLNQSFQGYNKMIGTMRDEFDTIKSQVSIFMTMDWLVSSFHENIFKMKSTLMNILNEIGTTQHISAHKAFLTLNNQTLWLDIQSRLGSQNHASLKYIKMSTSIQEGMLFRDIVFKILENTSFYLLKTTPVPTIREESILVPDSDVNWVLLSKTEQKYYPSTDQTFCNKIASNFICKVPFLKILAETSDCAVKHMLNHQAPNCTHYELAHTHGYFQRLLSGSFLFVKPKPEVIFMSCENKLSKIKISQVGIISPPTNCKLIDGNIIFEAYASEQLSVVSHFKQINQTTLSLTKYQAKQPLTPLVLNSIQDHIKPNLKKIRNPDFSRDLKILETPYIVGGISVTSVISLMIFTFILHKTGCLKWVNVHWGKAPVRKQTIPHPAEVQPKKVSHIINMASEPIEVNSIIKKDNTRLVRNSFPNTSVRIECREPSLKN